MYQREIEREEERERVCVYMCVYKCVNVLWYVCVRVYVYFNLCVCIYMCRYVFVRVHKVRVDKRARMCAFASPHTHIETYKTLQYRERTPH